MVLARLLGVRQGIAVIDSDPMLLCDDARLEYAPRLPRISAVDLTLGDSEGGMMDAGCSRTACDHACHGTLVARRLAPRSAEIH